MKGDFSRLNPFDSLKQYTRVMQQQGRVQLDADWNEQVDILLHYLRTLAKDLIGPYGGPAGPEEGFGITLGTAADNKPDLSIGTGRYYVDGLLCENRPVDGQPPVSYLGQPDPDAVPATLPFLVYLDVWERHVTCLQDDSIREVALEGADTTSRAQVVWRVRADTELPAGETTARGWPGPEAWGQWVEKRHPGERGRLRAQARRGGDDTDPCTASPEASYRGTENQLYRVEVQGWDQAAGVVSLKWSRDNGSVVFAVEELAGEVATLASPGRDDASGLRQGDWVEIVDDDSERAGIPGPLRQVKEVDAAVRTVTLVSAGGGGGEPRPPEYREEDGGARAKHALLRRWDHRESPQAKNGPKPNGAVLATPQDGPGEAGWVSLENGIRVQLLKGAYRPGDYWLIPARTATGDVEWPGPPESPEAMPPNGVEHHYAPLALVVKDGDKLKVQQDLRKVFAPLAPV